MIIRVEPRFLLFKMKDHMEDDRRVAKVLANVAVRAVVNLKK